MVKLKRTIESYFSNQSKTSNEAFSVQIYNEQTSENCETRRKNCNMFRLELLATAATELSDETI